MTKIIKLYNNWKDVKNVSRTTVNKQHSEVEASENFKKKILISEHSPIREIKIRWKWESIKSWISVHFSRHSWECYVSTQRSDRTGINRDELPQGTVVNMDCSANAQHLIDTSRKRLCYCSSKETREYWENLKIELRNSGEKELADVLVPNGIYRAGCPEFDNCGYCDRILEKVDDIKNIQDRYNVYNEVFHNSRGVDK